jgi:hypothetical protein
VQFGRQHTAWQARFRTLKGLSRTLKPGAKDLKGLQADSPSIDNAPRCKPQGALMKSSLFTRLAILAASVAITFVLVDAVSLLGHPQTEAGAKLADSGTVVVVGQRA